MGVDVIVGVTTPVGAVVGVTVVVGTTVVVTVGVIDGELGWQAQVASSMHTGT